MIDPEINFAKYDPMADTPKLDIATTVCVPLHEKNRYWCVHCEPRKMREGPEFIYIYSQNINSVSDSVGILSDQVFLHMQEAEASVFTFNETHRNDMNPKNRAILKKSRDIIFNQKDGHYC